MEPIKSTSSSGRHKRLEALERQLLPDKPQKGALPIIVGDDEIEKLEMLRQQGCEAYLYNDAIDQFIA